MKVCLDPFLPQRGRNAPMSLKVELSWKTVKCISEMIRAILVNRGGTQESAPCADSASLKIASSKSYISVIPIRASAQEEEKTAQERQSAAERESLLCRISEIIGRNMLSHREPIKALHRKYGVKKASQLETLSIEPFLNELKSIAVRDL